ncbi:beta-ketoacyl reductase, partial [Kitasatospora sp. NPDC092286]|uniref:beta-ketoacyl reductase n=1 Tax=Kitasatospora sp. NPDC092286 TaxID=3364087 RepID=UPI0037FF33FE
LLASVGVVPDVVVVPLGGDGVLPGAARGAVSGALKLVQEWLADERFESARLVVLTRGAVPVGGVPVDLVHAPVWGLVRSAQAEHPERFVLVDVDELGAGGLTAALGSAESQLVVRDGVVLVPRLVRASAGVPAPVSAGRVLVTGASGTLGGLVARRLVVEHGVRELVLLSRRPAEDLAAELRALGAEVLVVAGDVADRATVAEAVGEGVSAVFHVAGVVDDGVVSSLTEERVGGVLAPKVDGAWHLHELAGDLDAFVLFSSAAATFGGPGQGSYAAANAFLDALAAHRRELGLPGVSLGWGLWEERSELTRDLGSSDLGRMARFGVTGMASEEALGLLDALATGSQAHALPMRLDTNALRELPQGQLPSLLRALVPTGTRRTAATTE